MARRQRKRTNSPLAGLAAQIREMRVQQNLNQGQFAQQIGVSQQTVSDWERGKRLRQVHVAMRLLRLLGGRP